MASPHAIVAAIGGPGPVGLSVGLVVDSVDSVVDSVAIAMHLFVGAGSISVHRGRHRHCFVYRSLRHGRFLMLALRSHLMMEILVEIVDSDRVRISVLCRLPLKN